MRKSGSSKNPGMDKPKRNPTLAGLLSLLVPGLGQIYIGCGNRGVKILVAAIVIGNLNLIILPLIAMANPTLRTGDPGVVSVWAYWIPRIGHDVISVWSFVFWGWVVWDAASLARREV